MSTSLDLAVYPCPIDHFIEWEASGLPATDVLVILIMLNTICSMFNNNVTYYLFTWSSHLQATEDFSQLNQQFYQCDESSPCLPCFRNFGNSILIGNMWIMTRYFDRVVIGTRNEILLRFKVCYPSSFFQKSNWRHEAFDGMLVGGSLLNKWRRNKWIEDFIFRR